MSIKEGDKEFSNNQEQDARLKLANLLEECKIWKTTHEDFPSDVQEMLDEGASNISKSTLKKWDFEIDIELDTQGSADMTGSINAESLEDMPGGDLKLRQSYNSHSKSCKAI